MDYLARGLVPMSTTIISGIVLLLFIMAQLFRFVLRGKHVNSEVLCAGISIYFVLALAWALADRLACQFNPQVLAFSGSGHPGNHPHPFDAL